MRGRRESHSFFRRTGSLTDVREPKSELKQTPEDIISISDVHFVNNSPKNSNSAYVQVKIFRKPIIAKMLVDSGNLVSDLISEEFAKLARVPYEPVQKKVGTAAKGGSVNIIGKCKPFKIFIENVSKAIIIEPFILKELSHPINVGREFLGRYKGRLEFSPSQGFLEICGQKTKLIDKRDELSGATVTDERIKKVAALPEGRKYSAPQMFMEGMLNQVEGNPKENVPIYPQTKLELPAHSAMLVPITTRGQILIREVEGEPLLMEATEGTDQTSLLIPGIFSIMENESYCFVVNPAPTRITLHPDEQIGKATILREGTWSRRVLEEKEEPEAKTEKEATRRRNWIEEKLKLKENKVVQRTPGLKAKLVELFEENFEALSQHEFDYGHTTAVQCQIQLKKRRRGPGTIEGKTVEPGTRSQHAESATRMGEGRSRGKESKPMGFSNGWSEEERQCHASVVCRLPPVEQKDGEGCLPFVFY